MLPRKKRLPPHAFRARAAQTILSPYFLLKVSPNKERHNRFGIVISKEAVKKSVERHFWKRRLREALRKWPERNYDALVIVSKNIKNAAKEEVRRELENIFKKIKPFDSPFDPSTRL